MSAIDILELDQAPPGAPEPEEARGGHWWAARDAGSGQLLAAVHWQPLIGQSRPRYSFHLGRLVHAASELGLHQVQTTLQLGHDASGEAELSGWWLANASAPSALDILLVTVLQAHRQLASPGQRLIAELPGYRDSAGRSPFWDGLVQPFLPAGSSGSVEAARQRLGPAFCSHLGPLLPRQLIHAVFLPDEAQQALGRTLASHEPWRAALQRVGFNDWRHCRIDDGGPLLAA